MPIRTSIPAFRLPAAALALVVVGCIAASLAAPGVLCAQDVGAAEPAPSAMIKTTINRSDPIKLLLDRKKQLDLNKTQEDTLKALGKEMRHMEDVVFSDIDKAAKNDKDNAKGDGSKGRSGPVSELIQERIKRLQDIQSAYHDRALGFLTPAQRAKSDSLDVLKQHKGGKTP